MSATLNSSIATGLIRAAWHDELITELSHYIEMSFPTAQFAVMGVLGPQSNAHGPNEFLHLEYAERLTGVLTHLLNDAASAL